jgi:uncharacterized protein (TIGR02466 family)
MARYRLEPLFASPLYRAQLGARALNVALEHACLSIAREDLAGQRWCKEHGYKGYTSYASLDDLPQRAPEFADLAKRLQRHAQSFCTALAYDLDGRRLSLDSLWINVLKPGGQHTAHLHPHAIISGTYYVCVPPGAGAIRFEDPRLAMFMAAPPRKAHAPLARKSFVTIAPRVGTLLLWESFLRHDVPANAGKSSRISISFNFAAR